MNFNTSMTRTTRYGYSNTITLAEAMILRESNRRRDMCINFGRAMHMAGMAMVMIASRTK